VVAEVGVQGMALTFQKVSILGHAKFGHRRLGATLRHWHVVEINFHILGVKIVIVSKLAN